MKHLILFFAVVCCSIFVACEKSDDSQVHLISEDAQIEKVILPNGETANPADFKELSEEELVSFFNKTGISLSNLKATYCAWSDGYGGKVECDGGKCGVYEAPGGHGVGCLRDGELHIIGIR